MLTILDTINDEEIRTPATGTADEQEVAALSTAVNTALEAVTDPGHFITSPTGFPQFVEKTNFVTSGNQVTDYFLGDSDGDPLSAVATTLYVGTNQIFLYSLSPNIVVGRVGTGTTANASGAIALVLAVEETVAGGFVTAADMWVGLYAPLVHSGTNLIDSADALDLDELVYLGSDFATTTEIPFENFNGVAPGNNLFNVIFPSDGSSAVQLLLTGSASETLSTVNVSSTGIGAGSQHIDVGVTLRIDTVTGMVQANVNTAPEVNQSGNIDYTGRVEIVAADFEVSQVNPSSSPERCDIIISAFNAAGAAQEGAYLTDAIAGDGVPVTIDAADVRILDDAGNDITAAWLALANTEIIQMGDTVKIVGLNDGASNSTTDGDRVAFSTDNVPFDRFLITNVDPGGTTLDVANIHVTAIETGSETEYAELGSHLLFQDDGPTIVAQTNNAADVIHDETPGLTDDDVLGTAFLSGGSGPSVAGLFSGVVGGEDPDVAPASGPIGYARSGGSLLTISSGDAGADGPGANPLTYAISVSNGTFSGVETTAGTKVFLYNGSGATAGLILGRVGTENAGGDTANASGTIAFALAVNSATGEVFVAHYLSLLHGTGGDSSFDERISLNTGVLSMSVTRTDSEGDTATDSGNDISLLVKFDDDGPGIAGSPNAGAPNNLEVANTNGASDSSSYVLTPGADGLKSFSIVGPADASGDFTWQYFDVDGMNGIESNEIKGFYKGNALYTLELENDGTYEFNMIGTLPSSNLALDVTDIKAGGPDTNSIIVGATNDPRSVSIAATGGAINESNDNVGVGNGNLDTNEALTFQLLAADGVTALSFQGLSIGTKTASGGTYGWTATLAGGGTITGPDIVVGKNLPIVIGPAELGGALITSITITKEGGSTTKIGLDDIDIFIPANDVQLGFSVRETDGDNDFVGQTFTVDIDGNNDGVYSSNVNALSAPLASLSSKNAGFVNDAGMALSVAAVSPTLSFNHHEDYLLL